MRLRIYIYKYMDTRVGFFFSSFMKRKFSQVYNMHSNKHYLCITLTSFNSELARRHAVAIALFCSDKKYLSSEYIKYNSLKYWHCKRLQCKKLIEEAQFYLSIDLLRWPCKCRTNTGRERWRLVSIKVTT